MHVVSKLDAMDRSKPGRRSPHEAIYPIEIAAEQMFDLANINSQLSAFLSFSSPPTATLRYLHTRCGSPNY